ncbi:MAG: hypothetical protein IJB59_12020, partial [Oscillospiraceae bacterium]|nr:hypothetical protein [Oscillospiraceae bacterium]
MEYVLDFSNILNASIAASWMVLAVIVMRFLLKKAPRWTHVALWGLVAVRLLLPFSIESAFSLIPSTQTVPQEILVYEGEKLQNTAFLDIVSNPAFSQSVTVEVGETVDRVQISLVQMTPIWILGMVALLIYTVISYWRLRRKVSEAVILRDNIFQSENVASPFVLGLFRPRIYLPYNMDGQDLSHVVAHEQAHIRRRDHWWKPLGFLLLTIHWFNPLMWLAYVLLCRDIELACDEKVIKELGNEQRADYTQALVACSVNRRMIAACPLAFGEVGVKERVKSVMNYKKPAFWVVVLAVIACVVVAVCFLTNPMGFQFDEATHTIVSANHFDMRNTGDAVAVEMNSAQISELSSRLAGVKNTKKSDEYGGLTPGYQISALLEDGTYIRISGYSLSDNNIVDIEWNGERYLVSDEEFQDYLSRICAGGDVSSADNAVTGKTYLYEGEGIMGSFTITLYDDGSFTYYEGMASSYLGDGSWTQDGDTITLTDYGQGGYGLVNHFKLDGDDLVFIEQDSDNFIYVKVKGGEKFNCTGESFKQKNSTDGTVQIMPSQKLSLNDVIMLSQKGYDLTWSDFEQFEYIETGSGLYIRVYEINEMYELWIGGSWIDEDPMYIYLTLADDLDTRIDIRDGGVTEFIGADHSEVLLTKAIHEAILSENKPSKPDGLYHCASFVLLDQQELSGTPAVGSSDHTRLVTVYGLALHQGFGYSGGTFHDAAGSHIAVAITFEVVDGKYALKEYWTPRDGSYYVQDIRDKFPDEVEDEALDTQRYILAQKQECYDQGVRYGGVDTYSAVEHLFEVIESSPTTSSRPADYIDAHPIEYRELMYYGDYTLQYIFSKFHLEGNQTGLRGH